MRGSFALTRQSRVYLPEHLNTCLFFFRFVNTILTTGSFIIIICVVLIFPLNFFLKAFISLDRIDYDRQMWQLLFLIKIIKQLDRRAVRIHMAENKQCKINLVADNNCIRHDAYRWCIHDDDIVVFAQVIKKTVATS